MKYQTIVQTPSYPFRITPESKGIVIGSCFATNIGAWLERGKMALSVNPFGILYNPASTAQALERLWSAEPFTANDLSEHNGLWHSFSHHGDFSGTDKEAVLANINTALAHGAKALQEADYLMLTFGSSWIYERQSEVVANCHKLPSGEFTRRRLSVGETVELIAEQIERWSDKRVILTVSPVIHRGDGLVENQLSKASLIVAAHELAARFPGRVDYFPAYEIVTSELRDYRFYGEDMCHPSPLAVAVVRERFAEALLSSEAVELITATQEILRAMEHRPTNTQTAEYERFRTKMLKKTESLKSKYKNVNFERELRFFG